MKKGGKNYFSKVIAWIHLWPSLISALALVVVCLTGTIVVYGDEIVDHFNKDALYVKSIKKHKVSVQTLIQNYKKAFPNRRVPWYIVSYRDSSRTVKFNSYEKDKGLRFVYMDPYTGKIIKDDGTVHFFFIAAHIHAELLLHKPGSWIVSICTIIFLIELITGLILWWPNNWSKREIDNSFKIKWSAKWIRINYDLHNVLGFYAFIICFLLTITGLIIAFKPLSNAALWAFGGKPNFNQEKMLPKPNHYKKALDLIQITDKHFKDFPEANAAQIYTFKMDSLGYYSISYSRKIGLKSGDGFQPLFIDKYNGKLINKNYLTVSNLKIENTYWALHMGTYWGWIGKLLTFIGGLIGTSLPITGFIIWWNRKFKKKSTKVKLSSLNI